MRGWAEYPDPNIIVDNPEEKRVGLHPDKRLHQLADLNILSIFAEKIRCKPRLLRGTPSASHGRSGIESGHYFFPQNISRFRRGIPG